MQITINRAALARELALLASVAEKKTTIPILSNVRLDAAGDSVTLTATDLENGLTVTIPAEVKEAGAITIPAKRFNEYVQQLSGETVTIKAGDNQWATVTSGKARARIAGMSAESFPELPATPEATVSMDARALARQFARVGFAISTEEARFTLNGALVEVSGSVVRCVATDGHRLALTEMDAATGTQARLLVSKVTIGTYARIADQAEGGARVEISTDDNHLFFAIGQRRLIARKLTGNFPDYGRILPNYDSHLTIERAAFISALERVCQFADERSRAVRLKFAADEVTISGSSIESGESEESVPCEGAMDLEMGVNGQYVIDALKAISHPQVAVLLKDAKSAVEMRPMAGAGTEQDPYRMAADYRYVVMPMRI